MKNAPNAIAVVDLCELALRFGRVDRITYHPDGKRVETDTDHTVMLALVAPAFAEIVNQAPHFGRNALDLGLISQFAVVHDLVEAYAGDTPTLSRQTKAAKRSKGAREHDALVRIQDEMAHLPWVARTIEIYEAQVLAEARFVRAMDKLLPKALAILNGGATVREQGVTREALLRRYADQRKEIVGYAGEFTDLIALRDDLTEWMLDHLERRGVWAA